MKALVCHAFGPIDSLVYEDVPDPKPVAGQVVIGVRACGINFPDTLIVQGKYQFKPAFPFSPGGEVAGVVEAVGAGVKDVKVGDRVVATHGSGGMAEQFVTDASHVIPMPEGLDFAIAAALPTAYGTTLHALRDRADLKAGESLLVLGAAGGVGLAAVQIGKRMGARVIAAASGPEKLAFCKENGADDVVDYAQEDLKERVKTLTGGAGVDVVYDAVGGKYSEPALRATGWQGRFLVIGFAAGDIPKIPLNLTLLKGCSIVGVFWGMAMMRDPAKLRGELRELLAWAADGSLKPHLYAKYPLERALDALKDIEARRVKGKAVVVVGGAA
ncbi:MAG TPA: NADPH:quinone oxidoreductase family protein [Polyangiaceae bacterium]|jgi:NADPH2:quinone reductase|nr:NADPH:quinone oxidoreductase family protein [Polyangiaceae bacterium]